MIQCLSVGIGGFFGSIMRYLIGLIPVKDKTVFPIQTLFINVLGAFLIGVIISLFAKHTDWDENVMLMLKVGFCGGFTTFSTFSSEALKLMESGNRAAGILYILLSVLLGIAAVYCGQHAVR